MTSALASVTNEVQTSTAVGPMARVSRCAEEYVMKIDRRLRLRPMANSAATMAIVLAFAQAAMDATDHPHVTMLQQFVRTDDLDKIFAAANAVAEPFPSCTFSVAGASVYQLGTIGTARKELEALTLAP